VICLAKVKKKRKKDCALMTSASFYRSKQNATSKFRMNFPRHYIYRPKHFCRAHTASIDSNCAAGLLLGGWQRKLSQLLFCKNMLAGLTTIKRPSCRPWDLILLGPTRLLLVSVLSVVVGILFIPIGG
jgi:hypothetical protein